MNNEFKIKFDGEIDRINADTLIYSLLSVTTIIQEINNELQTEKKIEIKIKALERGSFLINIELVESLLDTLTALITKNNITAGSIVAALIGILKILKHLKGKSPKKIERVKNKVSIENEDGKVTFIDNRTYNIFNKNSIIQNEAKKNFKTLENDNSIESFGILDKKDKSLVKIDRKDFKQIGTNIEVIKEDRRLITNIEDLYIFKLVWDSSRKWEFIYKGEKISAIINDQSFFERIDKGESFSKGDILKVELIIHQKFESDVNTYINEKYEISKVLDHIPRFKQQELDL